MSIFLETHMEMKDRKNKSTATRKFDLEEEHSKLIKQLDLDNFSLSRIPRPEENSKTGSEMNSTKHLNNIAKDNVTTAKK